MDFLLIAIVAAIAIVSVSVMTIMAIKMVLSDDINLAKKIRFILGED
ncbi:hypothetical protein NE686_17790 [Tissierella carlieri]|uniref:Uncharacterized protein n=1 Tax=Tissierella carlieri TaxID=689904 RepID=A0ABT1SEN9_9FIRM|nr:hypothetical protein [Tissierella carlieri]MCQ4924957.1 hypothetical protein [Tissierella carlieri]